MTMIKSTECFPKLGFPNEVCHPMDQIVVYQCKFKTARIVVWKVHPNQSHGYQLNLYHNIQTDNSITHYNDRIVKGQVPLDAADPLEVQMLIFHLLQKYLPEEVTHEEVA